MSEFGEISFDVDQAKAASVTRRTREALAAAACAPIAARPRSTSRSSSVRMRESSQTRATSATRARSASPAARTKTVKIFDAMVREIAASLEQSYGDRAYWVFKYVPSHLPGTKAPPAQVYAMHIEPGNTRFLTKLDDVGLDINSLITEQHVRKFTGPTLVKMGLPAEAADAVNYWAAKAFGTQMSVNKVYGTPRDVQTINPARVVGLFRGNYEALHGLQKKVVMAYMAQKSIPIRDAVGIATALRWSGSGVALPATPRDTLKYYNAVLALLRKNANADKQPVSLQHVALSHAIDAWLGAERQDPAAVANWPADKYSETRHLSDSFFSGLDWAVVSAAVTAAVENTNELAMKKAKKEIDARSCEPLVL